METIRIINRMAALLFMLCYSYQLLYTVVGLLFRKREGSDRRAISLKRNRYAILICARNEETVIADLLRSIGEQSYPPELIDTYVIADNCTDGTAETARNAGAHVFERNDRENVGKGYALNALLKHIAGCETGAYDGYFVFDADNLLAKDYIEQMDRMFAQGYDIVTGYRNSKNYGFNWISAGYALWFIRESVFLNFPRHLLGSSCNITGTGFLFSRKIAEEMQGWPYHTLTEDLEFTADQVIKGRKVAFCRKAELYDEQPVEFRQSWDQRIRWSRGFLQLFGKYGRKLIHGAAKGSFSCFDMAMSIMPAFILSLVSGVTGSILAAEEALAAGNAISAALPLLEPLISAYFLLFFVGAVTMASEWGHIHAAALRKIGYLFTFPLFMLTYIPIALTSLFVKAQWKPIRHTFSSEKMKEINIKGAV